MLGIFFLVTESFYGLFSDEDGFNDGPSFHGYYSSNVGISPHTSDVNLVSKSNLQDNSSIKRYFLKTSSKRYLSHCQKSEGTILVVITPTSLYYG